jgi:hypothetical protein
MPPEPSALAALSTKQDADFCVVFKEKILDNYAKQSEYVRTKGGNPQNRRITS